MYRPPATRVFDLSEEQVDIVILREDVDLLMELITGVESGQTYT